jgi:hypothetical protein
MLLVLYPVSCVLSSQFAGLIPPVSALPMTLVSLPQTLVFVSFLVELNAETIFLVLFPVSNVPRGMLPLLALDAAVLLPLLFLNSRINIMKIYLDPVN